MHQQDASKAITPSSRSARTLAVPVILITHRCDLVHLIYLWLLHFCSERQATYFIAFPPPQDRFAVQEALPPIDSSQDWFLVRGVEEGGYTILEFTRNWTTCDDRDRDISVIICMQ